MDLFDSRYFNINKKLLRSLGLWPYDEARKKYLGRFAISLMIMGMCLPHFIGIFVNFDKDKRILLEHIGAIMLTSVAFVNVIHSIVSEGKLKFLYDNITANWAAIVDVKEKEILLQYSEMGRLVTLGWLIYLVVAMTVFITFPLTPVFLDIIRPLNVSRTKLHIMNGEFFIDRETNYKKLFLFETLGAVSMAFVYSAYDTMYAVCVEHCLGLFSIIGYRLQVPNKLIENAQCDHKCNDEAYNWMIHIIRLHNKVLKFTFTLESTYEQTFFGMIGLNLIYNSLLCVLTLLHSDNLFNFARFVMLCSGSTVHLFYMSWPGQKLIDHSLDLHQQAYLNQWYLSSARTKVLLNLFMLRCSKPSMLTAGGLYIMNFDNSILVMKKSVSFMAVFSSFR